MEESENNPDFHAFMEHISHLVAHPDMELQVDLFRNFRTQLNDGVPAYMVPAITQILPKLIYLLNLNKHDASLIVSIAMRLIEPLSFTEILGMTDKNLLIHALLSPNVNVQLLAIAVIERAAGSVNDTAILSNMQDLLLQFIHTMFQSEVVEIGEAATRTMISLLKAEFPAGAQPTSLYANGGDAMPDGPGALQNKLFWRRILNDRDIYAAIFFETNNGTLHLTERNTLREIRQAQNQRSLAQHRLMNIVCAMAVLDFNTTTQASITAIEEQYGLTSQWPGLLCYVSLHMVDHDDVLQERVFEEFYQDLLRGLSTIRLNLLELSFLRGLTRQVIERDPNMVQLLDQLVLKEDESDETKILLRQLRGSL